jgi:hypothetical protein
VGLDPQIGWNADDWLSGHDPFASIKLIFPFKPLLLYPELNSCGSCIEWWIAAVPFR